MELPVESRRDNGAELDKFRRRVAEKVNLVVRREEEKKKVEHPFFYLEK